MGGVLQGIRVLDFGRYIAGPFCATMLGDMGAEVIRVEKKDGSEDRFPSSIGNNDDGPIGALFVQMNRNKKGMTLNPRKPEGVEIVKKLVATADVVVANMPLESLQAAGLDYDTLKSYKSDIILAAPSAFGSVGPYAKKVGFDGVAQAMSGNMHLSGDEHVPTKAWVPWVDFGTALSAAFGVMGALMHRDKSGEGQLVETTLLGTSLAFNAASLIEQYTVGADRVATGNRGQTAGPSDSFQTKDGWILIQIVGRPLYERWARMMGEDHWLTDERFSDDDDRGAHAEILTERTQAWASELTTEEALAQLAEARIPCGEILNVQQTLDHPHVNEAPFLKFMDYPGVEKSIPLVATPVRMHGTPAEIRHRAPMLGEHTDEIMSELGYGADEISALKEKRVI